MPSVTTQERLYALTLPRHWNPPSFQFNQYVGWGLDQDGNCYGSGWVIGINYDIEDASSKSDGYFYNILVAFNCKYYQDVSLEIDDPVRLIETFYSHQLKTL
jgi:hypothetical protein